MGEFFYFYETTNTRRNEGEKIRASLRRQAVHKISLAKSNKRILVESLHRLKSGRTLRFYIAKIAREPREALLARHKRAGKRYGNQSKSRPAGN